MHIDNILLFKANKYVKLSADVVFKNHKPERLWFETDLKNAPLISSDYSPFLAAVLLPCMKTGEDIVIEGSVDEKLLENTKQIMELIEKWDVGLKRITISSSSERSESRSDSGQARMTNSHQARTINNAVASFFSAGVDSFYTYLQHKNKKNKITNLILVHGFDIPLSNTELFEETKNIVHAIAKEEKINSIFVTTNAGEIIEKHLIWDFAHGGALAAVGLFISNGLNKIFIPGGLQEKDLFPYGTHPDLDRLWSTDRTEFVHDGIEYDRLGKIMNSISKSPLALKYLRVCTQNIKGKYNCGKCYKCLQTMIELLCANALDRAKTFGKLDLDQVRKMYYDYDLKYNLQGEVNLAILKKENREPALQQAIEESLKNSKKKKLSKKFYKLISSWDQKYNNRRLYLNIIKLNKNQDRSLFFKLLMKMRVLK